MWIIKPALLIPHCRLIEPAANTLRALLPSMHPFQSRAALSLLGYCYYYTGDFTGAVECYEQLTTLFPSFSEYKLYLAQALLQANMLPEALTVVSTV